MTLLCECLDFCVCRTGDVIILVGDFNLPNINWSDFEAPYICMYCRFRGTEYMYVLSSG